MYNPRHIPTATLWCLIILLLVSCGKKPATNTHAERKTLDSLIASSHNIDTLSILQKRMESEGNMLGSIIAYREIGKHLRNESRFDEALKAHNEGLKQAEAIGDTLEMVQALNNIGTDYRRMGVLEMAQDYHYRAYAICKASTDSSFTARKNRVVALNGLGNIYLTLGNYTRADSALRLALAGERELNSPLGQAINYANIGSIFRQRGLTDSAFAYFRKSMGLNLQINNQLGISLCHIYFGELYEKNNNYSKAINEYETALTPMQAMKDEWHAINPLIALAGIYVKTGNYNKALHYLDTARGIALNIKSTEHKAEIYSLYYKLYKRMGDTRAALEWHEKAADMHDSIMDMEKMNRIQNAGLLIERNRQAKDMNEAQLSLKSERNLRSAYAIIFSIVVTILLGAIGMFIYIQRIHRRNHLALKKLAEMRETFFTNITHEFRTPLTIILGLSQVLRKSKNEEVKQYARDIEIHGNGQLKLVNQLLDISKIKSNANDLKWRNGDITTYISMVVASYNTYARNKDITLRMHGDENVVMDFVPDYAHKVIDNLLSNAFKFTHALGQVDVYVVRVDNILHIDVNDTGEGMDKETMDNVFKAFYQGPSDSQNLGTGVGLSLVKHIMESVHGTISVESQVGKGTNFHMEIAITNNCDVQLEEKDMIFDPVMPVEQKELKDSDAKDSQYTALVIEDNHDIAAFIGGQLAGDYSVAYATNGNDGLQKTKDIVPDIIITDIMMPGMDGLELCRKIRSNKAINHIPIIIVTAKVSEQERIEGFEAGADAYLTKPFSMDELRTIIEQLINRQNSLRNKFSEKTTSNKKEEKEMELTDAERRFLAKTVDYIYLLLDKQQLDVNTLAEKLCMSSRQFHRKIVTLTGNSPATFILKIKMKRARYLLETNPKLSADEIAFRCGFEHTSSFYHAFRKTYGYTPKEIRRGV
ncbi:hybrid sensor histidine kinase/response regulator transcription factor [Prevotella sp.]|uniref:hybrid sensor histidine kinase/response regulator transcription factor n=2 Tax=Prevotella TaxID=838 RepID=UPI0025FD2309|nr:response regulator [Prevotella sp.]MCI6128758.1 tetratricopeptide repeat protein [Prevotella sp.]